MRIVKEAEERRNEILDVAERLFGTKGFDGTSTTDMLNEIGIARGTLYYHFKSKEDILDAMIERMTGSLVAKASEIVENKDVPVLQRLTLMISDMKSWSRFISRRTHSCTKRCRNGCWPG